MMGFDGLRRAEPQELRPKAAHRANMSRLGVVGCHNKDVEIDEDSFLSFLKLRLTRKPEDKKEKSSTFKLTI